MIMMLYLCCPLLLQLLPGCSVWWKSTFKMFAPFPWPPFKLSCPLGWIKDAQLDLFRSPGVYCSPRARKELDRTELLNWNWTESLLQTVHGAWALERGVFAFGMLFQINPDSTAVYLIDDLLNMWLGSIFHFNQM